MTPTRSSLDCLAVGEEATAALRRLADPAASGVPDVYAAIHALRGDGPRPVLVDAGALADHPRRALRALRAAAAPHPVVCLPPTRDRSPRVERAAQALGVLLPPSSAEAVEALSGPRRLPGSTPVGRGGPATAPASAGSSEVAFADGCLRRLPDVAALERYVLRTLTRACGARRASLLRFEPGRTVLRLRAARGVDPSIVGSHRTAPGRGVAGRAAVLARPVVGRGTDGGPRGYRGTSYVVVPLGRSGECQGVACFTDLPGDRPPEPALLRSLVRMARRSGRALAAASRLSRAEALSTIDELTGLPNRRAFDRLLARDAERVRRGHGTLAVALFDVDRFKAVNDTHGHEAGDRVLVAVARRLQSALRASDVLCRWGGEEFAALLTDLPVEGAVEAAFGALERARRALAERPVPAGAGRPPLPCTVSAGFAVLKPGTADTAAVLRAADEALYAAKRAGRDRVLHA